MASIIVKRIQKGIDHKLQDTQFGFRKDRSTADAIHCVRNVLTHARATKSDDILVLLDWEKAFDKINHQALFKTFQRMGVDQKLINLIKAMYKKPTIQSKSRRI